jgi:hypothetical protein
MKIVGMITMLAIFFSRPVLCILLSLSLSHLKNPAESTVCSVASAVSVIAVLDV